MLQATTHCLFDSGAQTHAAVLQMTPSCFDSRAQARHLLHNGIKCMGPHPGHTHTHPSPHSKARAQPSLFVQMWITRPKHKYRARPLG